MSSLCTAKALRAYFFNDVLPENGLVCSTDEVLFPPQAEGGSIKITDLWAQEDKDGEAYSVEDLRLLEIIHALGRELDEHVGSPRRTGRLL